MRAKVPTYVADTRFLRDLIQCLTPGPDEEIAYVTGVKLGTLRVLSRIVPLGLAQQSPVYALSDRASTADALLSMLHDGNILHVMSHSHPGGGPSATFPSSIDLNYLRRVQRSGAQVIGLIVTRDGCVRAFSIEQIGRAHV